MFFLILTGALHVVLTLMDRLSGLQQSAMLGAALCANQLITCAQIFSVMEQVQAIQWIEPFLSFLQFFRLLSLGTLFESVRPSCITRMSPEMVFVSRNIILPLSFTIGPLLVRLLMIKMKLATARSAVVKTFGFLFLLFYISLCSSFTEPFPCNLHPNGLRAMQTAHEVSASHGAKM